MPNRTRSASPSGLHQEAERLLVNLLAEEHSQGDENGKHRLVIEAYGYRWYRVGGLDLTGARSSANWLRVSDTAERSQVDQRIGHQLHAIVPLLDTFKSEQQPLELVFPGKGSLDTYPSTHGWRR